MIQDVQAVEEVQPGVLHLFGHRAMRLGTRADEIARFSDDVWDLKPILLNDKVKSHKLHFQQFPPAYQSVVKELFRYLICATREDGSSAFRVSTIRAMFSDVRPLLLWLESQGHRRIDSIGQDDIELFAFHVLSSYPRKPQALTRLLRASRLFYAHRAHLQSDSLQVDVYTTDTWKGAIQQVRTGENATRRMPESVLNPLIEWAMRWINDIGPDVLGSLAEYQFLRRRGQGSERFRAEGRPVTLGEGRLRIEALARRYEAQGQKLPGWRDPKSDRYEVNYIHLSRQIDCTRETAYGGAKSVVQGIAERIGIDEGSFLDFVPTGRVGKHAWVERIEYNDVPRYAELLSAACYVVIAFFSGMRDDEIKSLQRGCLALDKDTTGQVVRRRLTGTAYKGDSSEQGSPATWVVGEPVRAAIEVLEKLQNEGQPRLFAPMTYRGGKSTTPRPAVHFSKTNIELRRLIAWVNDFCNQHPDVEQILHDGEPWHIATSQFRRTIAWFIARQPGGSIAGAIQFRHHSIQMFEGYAGTSDSGFRAEVEGEQALVRGEYLMDLSERQGELQGPAAALALDRAANFAERLQFPGLVADGPRQMKLLLAQDDPKVFPGEFVTCVFDASKAMCVRHLASAPEFDDCRPFECRNVSLDAANIEAWKADLGLIEGLLEDERTIAPFVRRRLLDRACKIHALLGTDEKAGMR